MSEILPCPFCGKPPKVNGAVIGFGRPGHIIRCENDDCFGPATTARPLEDAVAQWNTRAAGETITLSREDYDKFLRLLALPVTPSDNAELSELLRSRAPWETDGSAMDQSSSAETK